jgi:cohesin domain-containing protein
MRRLATAALVLAALGTGAARGAVGAGFAPADPGPASGSVTMVEGSRSGDLVTVLVVGSAPAGIFGAAFDVTYDSSGADYVGWAAGTVLEQGGGSPNYTVAPSRNGTVVVGASRTGTLGVPASGQAIVSLIFRVRRAGAFPLAFRNAALYDSRNPPQPIGGIVWRAGILTGS